MKLTGRMIDTSTVRLHVVEEGPEDGWPLILLHGFPECGWAWRKQVRPLAARGFRVIVPDLRGYGGSDAPPGVTPYAIDRLVEDVLAVADACGAARFCLAGHDWGGVIAWATAARHPERVRRLVALAAPHPATLGPVMRRHPSQLLRSLYVGFFQVPWLPEFLLSRRRFRSLRRSMVRTSRPGTFPDADLDRYAAAWRGRLTPMLNYYRALRLPRAPIGRIAMPTLILWGGRDAFLGRPLAVASRAMCDQATLQVREDATHWLHLEEAFRVSTSIADFCGEE